MNKTSIEYMDYSWNPLAMRCTPVSAGCKNCWHLRMADRLAAHPRIPRIQQRAYAGETGPTSPVERRDQPFKLRRPSRIGVQFMGDLFHEDVPLGVITGIFDTMADARCEHHTFLILTKRPQRMLDWFAEYGQYLSLPLENIQVGVSVENQKTAGERIPLLLQIPAAVIWVSVEPMLEAVDFREWTWDGMNRDDHPKYKRYEYPTAAIDWFVCGSESGPGARPMDEDWVRDLRDQCVAADVPFLYKQQIVNGKRVNMPELDGKIWNQYPGEAT